MVLVNFQPLFEFSGFKVNSYPYFDKEKRCVDFDNILKAVTSAPSKSIFVLQPCAHNPTGADLTATQWQELADAMKVRMFSVVVYLLGLELIRVLQVKDHFPFFGELQRDQIMLIQVLSTVKIWHTQAWLPAMCSLMLFQFGCSPIKGLNWW